MKKTTIPSYLMRTKWFVFLLVAIVLIVFGRTVDTPSLIKSAIVLGIGIDYIEDNDTFEVTAQSAIVGSSSGDTTDTTFNTYTAEGKTIAGAMDGISRKMGLIVSLAHCNVIVLSQSALTLDHMQLIYPLTGMYALPEQTILVSSPQKPKELLALRIGTTLSAPFFLQQALVNEEGSDGMIRTTAKDFLARSLSRSKANAVPYVRAQKLQDAPIGQQGNDEDAYTLDFNDALVFNHDKAVVIEREYAEILAFYLSKDVTGTLNITDEDDGTMEFKILKKDVKLKANDRHLVANVELSLDLSDVQHVDTDKVLDSASEIVRKFADLLEDDIEKKFYNLYDVSRAENIDFLNLQAKAYQSIGRDLEEDCLDTLSFEVNVKISVKETG